MIRLQPPLPVQPRPSGGVHPGVRGPRRRQYGSRIVSFGVCCVSRVSLPDLREGSFARDRNPPGGTMSVIMTFQVVGDPKALEQFASDNTKKAQGIREAAKRHGLIAHRFYGSED